MDTNPTIFQAFEWYSVGYKPSVLESQQRTNLTSPMTERQSYWTRLHDLLPQLTSLGVTSIWIPPACKATGPLDNGYGIYDLYDLGEFNTKQSIATKWGTKTELQDLCAKAQSLGVGIIFDAVLNHRASPDESETCHAVRVDPRNRIKSLDKHPRTIEAWTKFNYAARSGRYSDMKYTWSHFSGTDWDHKAREKGIFKIMGKRPDGSLKDWATDVGSTENGNYDYLMFADLDYGNSEVCEDVVKWSSWLIDTLPGISGFRLDAVKHYSASFQRKLINAVNTRSKKSIIDFFFVGEYWSSDSEFLASHLEKSFKNTNLHLFDVKLMYNFCDYSTGRLYDLRKIFSNSLVSLKPGQAVTFVTNHDTQETQSLAAPVESWFIPHSYAAILLRAEGIPCLFWGDVFGTNGPEPREPACGGRLMRLVLARKYYAYGEQKDYFDDPRCIGWVRTGSSVSNVTCGMAVILNTAWSWRKKRMRVGPLAGGQIWSDVMGWVWSGALIDREGYGDFVVGPRSISVWTWKDAPHRQELDSLEFPMEVINDDLLEDDIPSEDDVTQKTQGERKTVFKSPL